MKIEDKYERAAMLGWMVTGGTFQRVKAPVAVYSREGALPQAFYDVLYPTPPGAQADLKVTTLPVVDDDGKPVPPTEAACLVIEGKITRRKHEPGTLVPDLGQNLAQGKPATAEINQGDIAATSTLLTDGDLSAEKIPGAVSSSPYTPNVLLTGRFSVDLGQPAEVNAVVLHHGTWNGSQILYPAEKLTVQYWDGEKWAEAPEQQTTWRTASISETFLRPVTTSRLSVAVERPSGGRLALREFEAFRVTQAELDRVAAMRTETVTESFRDVCLISDSPSRRRYGDYWFDGDFALVRHDGAGRVKQLLLKNTMLLSNERDLNFETHIARRYYCNVTLADDGTATIETPYPGEMDLKVNNRQPRLLGTDGKPYDTQHDVTQGEFYDLKAVLEPAQPGFAGAQPSALVTWHTEKPAMSQVYFGENESFGRCTPLDRRLVTDHAVRVYFLRTERRYSFRVYATDGLSSVTCEPAP